MPVCVCTPSPACMRLYTVCYVRLGMLTTMRAYIQYAMCKRACARVLLPRASRAMVCVCTRAPSGVGVGGRMRMRARAPRSMRSRGPAQARRHVRWAYASRSGRARYRTYVQADGRAAAAAQAHAHAHAHDARHAAARTQRRDVEEHVPAHAHVCDRMRASKRAC
jgi:hypothetical protein